MCSIWRARWDELRKIVAASAEPFAIASPLAAATQVPESDRAGTGRTTIRSEAETTSKQTSHPPLQ